jgi:hypothetical protein
MCLHQVTDFDTENRTKDFAGNIPFKLIYSTRYTQHKPFFTTGSLYVQEVTGFNFYFLPSSGRFQIWLHMRYSRRKQFATIFCMEQLVTTLAGSHL